MSWGESGGDSCQALAGNSEISPSARALNSGRYAVDPARPVMIRRFGGPALSRSAVVSLVLGSLIAAPVFCASFAAYSGSLELSALIKEPKAGCDEKASFPSADEQQADQNIPCEPQGPTAEQDDRSYLLETASPGSTMMRQGPVIAIARLNPEFVARLASAIREARQSGLPSTT